jgi:hypothetical protein
MTVLSYILAGEAVDHIVSNRTVRQILSLSGLDPDADFPGFLTGLELQVGTAPQGNVNVLNFDGNAVTVDVVGTTATVTIDVSTLANLYISGYLQLGEGPYATTGFIRTGNDPSQPIMAARNDDDDGNLKIIEIGSVHEDDILIAGSFRFNEAGKYIRPVASGQGTIGDTYEYFSTVVAAEVFGMTTGGQYTSISAYYNNYGLLATNGNRLRLRAGSDYCDIELRNDGVSDGKRTLQPADRGGGSITDINLGAPTQRWNNIYLTGGISAGLVAKSGDYLATINDYVITVDATGGSKTITLPAAAGAINKIFIIKKMNAANTVTIDGDASETIDGATTVGITTQYESLMIQSDGSNWIVLAKN